MDTCVLIVSALFAIQQAGGATSVPKQACEQSTCEQANGKKYCATTCAPQADAFYSCTRQDGSRYYAPSSEHAFGN